MDADVRDQVKDGDVSSGTPKRQRVSDDADYAPHAPHHQALAEQHMRAAAAGGVVGDSDSAGSFRAAQPAAGGGLHEQQLPPHLRLQQQPAQAGGELNLHLLDLHHASSFASSLGNPNTNLAAVMAAAAANAAAAAAAATETTGTSKDDVSEDERVRRRREINRNSQKRIRERRNKEMDGLKTEATKLQVDNDLLLKQVEALTLEKADMLRQIQDLTEKWQQSIAENAWLNRENIQLRNSLQQLNTLVSGATAPGGGGGGGGLSGSSGGGGGGLPEGVLTSLALGLNLPLHGISSSQQG